MNMITFHFEKNDCLRFDNGQWKHVLLDTTHLVPDEIPWLDIKLKTNQTDKFQVGSLNVE